MPNFTNLVTHQYNIGTLDFDNVSETEQEELVAEFFNRSDYILLHGVAFKFKPNCKKKGLVYDLESIVSMESVMNDLLGCWETIQLKLDNDMEGARQEACDLFYPGEGVNPDQEHIDYDNTQR